jgi:hypothetical protein
MRITVLTLAAVAFAAPRPAIAQGDLPGTWTAEVDLGLRIENGVETSLGKRPVRLTITVQGDSVFGLWEPQAVEGAPAPQPMHLKGTRNGSRVTLASEPIERRVSINEEESLIKMVTTYNLELKADTLEGTTTIAPMDGSLEGHSRPFVARRSRP